MEKPSETKQARKTKKGKRVFRLKATQQSASRRKTTAHSNTARRSDPAVAESGAGAGAGVDAAGADVGPGAAADEVRCP